MLHRFISYFSGIEHPSSATSSPPIQGQPLPFSAQGPLADLRENMKKNCSPPPNPAASPEPPKKPLITKSVAYAAFMRASLTPGYQYLETMRSVQIANLAAGRSIPSIWGILTTLTWRTFTNGLTEQTAKAFTRETYRGVFLTLSSRYDLGQGPVVQSAVTAAVIAPFDATVNGAADYITESRSRALSSGNVFLFSRDTNLSNLATGVRSTFGIAWLHSFGFWTPCFLAGRFTKSHLQFTDGPTQTAFDVSWTALWTTLCANPLENVRKQLTGVGAHSHSGSSLQAGLGIAQAQGLRLCRVGFLPYLVQNTFTSAIMLYLLSKNTANDKADEIER